MIPLFPSVGFCSRTVCSLPHCHWSVSRAISEVISLRALVMAASRMSSRVSILSGVRTSSHHGFLTCFNQDRQHRVPAIAAGRPQIFLGNSSRKVSLKMLWQTTLKYAAAAESLVAE